MYLILYNTATIFVIKLLVHTIGGVGVWVVCLVCFFWGGDYSKASKDSSANYVIGINLEATGEASGSCFTKLHAIV